MFKKYSLTAVAATLITAGSLMSAVAAMEPAQLVDGALVDAKGMTLYTFDKDTADSGKSVCNGPCATLWPPALASSSDRPEGAFGIVTRDDGTHQWSYKGKPIYTYQADQKPGERAGDNFKNVWHIIKD
jgi:predicted lipoprotein with Yx(FWY)xxD motif